ncbi:thioredoxin-2-like isoform X2 [Teleopsis dalmanni]|nr:thioredoxin-2-like isoform X2 [Teleopsis dalmanni]
MSSKKTKGKDSPPKEAAPKETPAKEAGKTKKNEPPPKPETAAAAAAKADAQKKETEAASTSKNATATTEESTEKIMSINSKELFDKALASAGNKIVMVEFFAEWCGPCKKITPKLEELSTQYAERLIMLKVDVDDCEDIAIQYKVTSMPTFIFLKNNEKVEEVIGSNTDKIEKALEKLFATETRT